MKEKTFEATSGWAMLPVALILTLAGPASFIYAANSHESPGMYVVAGLISELLAVLTWLGLFAVQPNEARILMLFGEYKGTVRAEGFHWANPFSVTRGGATAMGDHAKGDLKGVMWKNKYRVSLRARNFQTSILKVNDQRGNPVEIAAVVVWRVNDTAEALFDVDDYEHYVEIQSEAAVRHLATAYPYDHMDGADETTLRGGGEKVTADLLAELQGRLSRAGVEVMETRIMHLAYAPEIAAVMLRRQQAEAIIAARQKIVHGAVSMVEMALRELSERKVVELDDERKAAMVGNLLVVLCGEAEAQPIVNAGTLYH
jgi:regulator of protease activity HflC (stomatin/prohibitin superfamily)